MFHNAPVMLKRPFFIFALIFLAISHPVQAEKILPAPSMILPIECELGWNCWIANYVDHERGPQTKDYTCGTQTYNAHKGTDFMIRNFRDMQAGVVVRAVSDGIVVGTRDHMKDIDYRKLPKEKIAKKQCGNGVRLEHKNGWITKYCHLRKNSVKVKKGDQVKQGDIIGLVGHSGMATFPHLHFQVEYIPKGSTQRQGYVVDPFVGISRSAPCEIGAKPLWPPSLLHDLTYRKLDIFDMGFAATQPKQSGLAQGLYDDETLSIRSPKLFLWGRFLHVKKGDSLTFQITAPDDSVLLDYTSTIDKDQAYRTLHAGLRKPTLNWDSGVYRGYIKLVRQDENGGRIYKSETTITLK
ncbi:M23 family metallopeptidase [Terasakiella sp. SH-1]|uniref:M23 family metallopeptidase n=1 Tax=Terasakiella sp. SH-1 TaxID=2560057 RepID=UPI0010742D2E|nr:M23 family metallopeptidase [Terasakiella sp. SH-1]